MRDRSAEDGIVTLAAVKLQGELVGLLDEDNKDHGAPVVLRGAAGSRELVAAGQAVNMAPAVITGVVAEGKTLSVVLGAGWTCGGYKWSQNGIDIAGQTGATYLVTAQDVGKTIQCIALRLLNNGWPASPSFALLTALQPA